MRNFATGYIILGWSGALLAVFLDSNALFCLFSYTPLFLAALGYGVVGIWGAAKEFRKERRVSPAILSLAVLVVALCFTLPEFRTSPRKGFHIDAATITPGMSVELVENKMKGYSSQRGEGYTAFVYRVNAHTEDRVIVDWAEDSTASKVEVVTN
jgi:hypothetical protein